MENVKEKQPLKDVEINNSDRMFVMGVLYGMMNSIELVKFERLDCSKDNMIGLLINDALNAAWGKIFQCFSLIRENQRVPDLEKMLASFKADANVQEGRKKLVDSIEKVWKTCKK